MAINTDSRGFIIGERRLAEMAQGIVNTQDNTKEILAVLSENLEALRKEFSNNTEQQRSTIDRLNRSGRSQNAGTDTDTNTRRTQRDDERLEERTIRRIRRIQNDTGNSEVSPSSNSIGNRQRDSRGRFIGGSGGSGGNGGPSGSSQSPDGEARTFISRFKDALQNMAAPDGGGLDPTVDAVKELTNFVSPVGRVFRGMGARAIGLFRGRLKRRRTEEVLPEEQARANREEQRSDRQRNKLLQRLIDAVRSSGGGSMLGGLFGRVRGGGGLIKGLLRKIPILGALLGGGALAKNWGGLDSGGKGKGIGTIIGTIVGGALGSFLGPVGTVAGGTLGAYLGSIFGQKVGAWTDTLKGTDFGSIFKESLKSTSGFAAKARMGTFGAIGAAGSYLSNLLPGRNRGGDGGEPLAPSNKTGKLSNDKARTISRVANNIGVDPNDLASIISFETSGTFNPDIKNPKSSATGLLQFMRGSGGKKGSYYGMSREEFGSLSFDEQMKYVEKYYKDRGFDGSKKRSLADAYTAVTGYGYKEGSKEYELNKVWDTDGNGVISKGEAVRAPKFQEHRKQWIKSDAGMGLPDAKGVPYRADILPTSQKGPSKALTIPTVKQELSKITSKAATKTSTAPSDSAIAQVVSDRSLAHIFSGSIGFDKHSA